ncbi:MAG: cofactor-independent phosphoglycerate mutase [Clostridia bacterium]|nr:cofactor-independent phosphoglycerate mutase [Clostridia bacterium]MBO7170903.1 cofactor-independent phosphoglycerate mutase [Clostridia bacterium]
MKYLVIVYDGMADRPIPALGNKTPLMVAKTPMMDSLTPSSLCGTVSNVPEGMVPESDTANLAILSYDPREFSKGRSPLEAVSMGIEMQPDETAYRCNVVTLSEEEERYEDKRILDHSADEITTAEADELIKALDAALGNEIRKFYTGISYRHCMIRKNGVEKYPFARPHDHIGQRIGEYLPSGDEGEEFLQMMKASYDILNHHPINEARRARGLRPANSAWFWSPGKKPALPSFKEKFGLDAAVISAVDLIKGIGLCAGMTSIDVEGATGNVHTNYKGKADAAIGAFKEGKDLVYVHVEGPDECGHRGETENKILSIESIDGKILAPVVSYLKETGEPFRVMCLPDHPTPIAIRTHSMEPVPFFIYDSEKKAEGPAHMDEDSAAATGLYVDDGTRLMDMLLKK